MENNMLATLAGVLLSMVAWGVVSLAGLPPLDGPLPPAEGPGVLAIMATVSIVLYGWAAWRTLSMKSSSRTNGWPTSCRG